MKSPVVQMDDYYPFGLTFNSCSREKTMLQKYKYNGKEEQTEIGLNWLDYGRRMYRPDLGRFFALDRFAEKYQALNPYHYGANNPIHYIDVNGDSLIVQGLAKDQFQQISNQGTGGFADTQIADNGAVTLGGTSLVGPPTREQQAYIDLLSGVISDARMVTIDTRAGTDETTIGSFGFESIDPIDMAKAGDGPVVSAQGLLIHEIVEQFGKQALGLNGNVEIAGVAHFLGVQAENLVNGSTRMDVFAPAPTSIYAEFDAKGFPMLNGAIDTRYVKDNQITTVRMIVGEGNVIEMIRK